MTDCFDATSAPEGAIMTASEVLGAVPTASNHGPAEPVSADGRSGRRGGPWSADRDKACWQGASMRRYRLEVFGLVECPPLADATYVLVRNDAALGAEAVHIGVAANRAPTLNLARIRHRAAQLGAHEVHVLRHGASASRSLSALARVARDLRRNQASLARG
jgi:hypothetical protein